MQEAFLQVLVNERYLSFPMSHLSIPSQQRRCYLQLVQVEDKENGCLEAIIKNDFNMRGFEPQRSNISPCFLPTEAVCPIHKTGWLGQCSYMLTLTLIVLFLRWLWNTRETQICCWMQVRRITNVVLIVLSLWQMPEIRNLRREGFMLAQSSRVHVGLSWWRTHNNTWVK